MFTWCSNTEVIVRPSHTLLGVNPGNTCSATSVLTADANLSTSTWPWGRACILAAQEVYITYENQSRMIIHLSALWNAGLPPDSSRLEEEDVFQSVVRIPPMHVNCDKERILTIRDTEVKFWATARLNCAYNTLNVFAAWPLKRSHTLTTSTIM